MTRALALRSRAANELDQAYQWYQERRDGLGIDFLVNVEEAFDDIRRSPESYAVVYRDVRQAFVQRFPYVICFVADSVTVTIISVFHGSRDPATWKRRI